MLNRMETFNEITIILVGYSFLSFSNFVLDSELKYDIGQITIFLVLFNIFINFCGMVRKMY